MNTATHDELAGVVDLFGGLTRDELERALVELAFKQGKEVDREAVAAAIDASLADYYLARSGADDDPMLVAGPVAFPSLPENAADLPHILDVERREIDRERAGEAVLERLAADAERALGAGDEERAARLLDVTYDLEAWAPVAAGEVRERLG